MWKTRQKGNKKFRRFYNNFFIQADRKAELLLFMGAVFSFFIPPRGRYPLTAVRVIPVPGKKVGDEVQFGGLLGRAPVMPVHPGDASKFIGRGGLIPAPIHSFKN